MRLGLWTRVGPMKRVRSWSPIPLGKGRFWGTCLTQLKSIGRVYGQLHRDGWPDRDAVWVVYSGGPKEIRVLGGPRSPPVKRAIWGVVLSHWKCIVTARAPKWAIYYNIHINYTIYTPTDSIWPQQYMVIVRLQIHIAATFRPAFTFSQVYGSWP